MQLRCGDGFTCLKRQCKLKEALHAGLEGLPATDASQEQVFGVESLKLSASYKSGSACKATSKPRG